MRLWVRVDTFELGSMKERALKPLEEASEAREAVQRWYPARDSQIAETRDALRHRAVYEACDTLQATCNLLASMGVDQAELDRTMREVTAHNEARGRYDGQTR